MAYHLGTTNQRYGFIPSVSDFQTLEQARAAIPFYREPRNGFSSKMIPTHIGVYDQECAKANRDLTSDQKENPYTIVERIY